MKATDQDCLHRWRHQRDAQAFEAIVRTHARMVYGTCLRIVRDPAEAQDLVQECFELLLHPLPREPRSLGAWLHGVATHRARMRLRSDARRVRREQSFADALQTAPSPSQADDPAQLIDETLAQLPEDLQDLIVRHYFLEQSHHEIARSLHIPRRTISNRMQRGLAQLAEALLLRGVQVGNIALAAALAQFASAAPALPQSTLDRLTGLAPKAAPALAPKAAPALAPAAASPWLALPTLRMLAWLLVGLACLTVPLVYLARAPRSNATPRGAIPAGALPTPTVSLPAAVAEQQAPPSTPSGTGTITGTVIAKRSHWQKKNIAESFRRPQDRLDQIYGLLVRTEEQPLPGIEIVLKQHGENLQATTSDAQGQFSFGGLHLEEFEVVASLPDDAVHYRENYRLHKTVVSLTPAYPTRKVQLQIDLDAAKFSGSVRTLAGQPIAGAALHCEVARMDYEGAGDETRGAPVETHSDDLGSFLLTGIQGYSMPNATQYLLHNGEFPYGDFYALITARADGYAAATLYAPAVTFESLDFAHTYLEMAKANPSQNEKIREVHFDPALLRATADRGFTCADFTLVPEATIAGILVDTRGTPLPNTRLRMFFHAEPAKPRAFMQTVALPEEVTTAADGTFVLNQLVAETYVFRANINENWKESRNGPLALASGEHLEGLQVVMPSGQDLGRVVAKVTSSDTAQPRPNLQVWLSDFEPADGKAEKNGKLSITNEGFAMEDVPPCLATFEVKAEGYATEYVRAQIEAGATTEITLALLPEGILTGTITRNGEPCAYGYVTLKLDDKHQLYTSTDKEGRYELKAVKPGDYTFNFALWLYEDPRGGAQQATTRRATIRSGTPTTLNLALEGSAILEGDFDGPEDLDWMVHLYEGDPSLDTNLVASTWKFKKNRHYELPDLPAGTYTAVAKCLRDQKLILQSPRLITLTDGTITTLDFHFPSAEDAPAPTP